MVNIKIKKGLHIPIVGKPLSDQVIDLTFPDVVALDLGSFQNIKFNFLAKPGSFVKIGDPIAQDKDQPEIVFVSPASGKVREILRGEKRRPLKVVIEVEGQQYREFSPPSLDSSSKEELLSFLSSSGFLTHIKKRPCDLIPHPKRTPEAIFIKALETAPFVPNASLQVKGLEKEFNKGLEVLSKLSDKVHLVFHRKESCQTFTEAKGVSLHKVSGPYPVCNPSLHIYHIHPILDLNQVVWTMDVLDVITLGKFFTEGKYHLTKVVSRSGELLPEGERKYLRVFRGHPLGYLISPNANYGNVRVISGNPLSGTKSGFDSFLGFFDYSVSLLKENIKRQPLHFFSLGANKYSATKGYLSGFFQRRKKPYAFTTNQHGEERAFVEADIYQDVMPMRIPVMALVKAILCEDFEKAVELGLLEIAAEDFILPTFICPSKVEMFQIVKEGLLKYADQYLAK